MEAVRLLLGHSWATATWTQPTTLAEASLSFALQTLQQPAGPLNPPAPPAEERPTSPSGSERPGSPAARSEPSSPPGPARPPSPASYCSSSEHSEWRPRLRPRSRSPRHLPCNRPALPPSAVGTARQLRPLEEAPRRFCASASR